MALALALPRPFALALAFVAATPAGRAHGAHYHHTPAHNMK